MFWSAKLKFLECGIRNGCHCRTFGVAEIVPCEGCASDMPFRGSGLCCAIVCLLLRTLMCTSLNAGELERRLEAKAEVSDVREALTLKADAHTMYELSETVQQVRL